MHVSFHAGCSGTDYVRPALTLSYAAAKFSSLAVGSDYTTKTTRIQKFNESRNKNDVGSSNRVTIILYYIVK